MTREIDRRSVSEIATALRRGEYTFEGAAGVIEEMEADTSWLLSQVAFLAFHAVRSSGAGRFIGLDGKPYDKREDAASASAKVAREYAAKQGGRS